MLDNIKVFIQLVDTASFTQLSKILNVNRTTISRKIRDLEIKLNISLIKHDSKKFEITDDGQKFYEYFKDSTKAVMNTWQKVSENYTHLHGTLNLSISSENIKVIILEHLPKFLLQYPEVKINISFTSELQAVNLINQKFDIAISSIGIFSSSHQMKNLYTFRYKLFTSKQYVDKYGIPKSLNEISKHRLIGHLGRMDGDLVNCVADKTGINEILSINSNLYIDNTINNIIEIINSGEYISYAWQNTVRSGIDSGMIIPVLAEYTFNPTPYYLILRANSTKLENTFAQFLEDTFYKLKEI